MAVVVSAGQAARRTTWLGAFLGSNMEVAVGDIVVENHWSLAFGTLAGH
jgi:hypothetical protein